MLSPPSSSSKLASQNPRVVVPILDAWQPFPIRENQGFLFIFIFSLPPDIRVSSPLEDPNPQPISALGTQPPGWFQGQGFLLTLSL